MEWLQHLPIRRKLTITIVSICGAVLLLACAALAVFEFLDFRRTLVREATVMADIVGTNIRAALAFDDAAAAREVLRAVAAEPHVMAAGVYTRDGRRFAEFLREGVKSDLPDVSAMEGARFEAGALNVFRPVVLNEKWIGTVHVRTDLDGIRDRLVLFAGIAALVLLGSMAVAFGLSAWLQRPIAEPILALAETARAIAERKDYSVRAARQSGGEVGVLTEAFNQMLTGIEEREAALHAVNTTLRGEIAERRRTEEALAMSEQHYRSIFANSPMPMWVYDVDDLRFLAVNNAAQAHYGYTEAEFLAMTIKDLRPAEDVPALLEDVARAAVGSSHRGEWRHRTKDGTLIDVVVHAHDIGMKQQRARLVVAEDITERRRSDRKIREQLAWFAQLDRITRAIGERQDMGSIFQAVIRSMEEQMPVDFACVCLYDAAMETLTVSRVGVRSEALATQLTLAPHARLPIHENGLSRCIRGQLVYEPDVTKVPNPFPQQLAAGGLRSVVLAPLLVESQVFGVLVAGRCETERFSSGDCEFLRQLSEHVALAAHQAQLHAALQRAYDDLRQTQQTVMQQERLRALGQMASGIAHDINNAISPVSLYVESLLETESGLSAKAREWLGVVGRAIDDVSHTVARLREFYRQREPQLALAPVRLNRIIDQVAELTRARWWDMPQQRGAMIELRRELPRGLPEIMAVESEIREALINLVFNAADAMADGGVLTLRTRTVERVRAGEAQPEMLVAVEVTDTGPGMDEDTQRRCLEPFFTTKGERGTGLGLAMVYGIVRRHGAEIEIDSVVGRGTTMRLLFGVAEPKSATAGPAPAALKPAARLRLLIIDDDPMLLKSLRETLEGDGHVIVTANGGQAGILAFQTAAPDARFAAVFTDLGMPYVDGRKVASAIKSASPTTPVFLLTGWGQRLLADGDIPPHVDRVLSKPPKLRELRAVLATVAVDDQP